MAKKAADRGKEIVLELVGQAKTPELKAALAQLGADAELLTMLGDKTLKQDEFSRLANELKAKEEQFNADYLRVQQHEREVNDFYTTTYRDSVLGAEITKAGGLDKFLETRMRGAGSTGEEEESEQPRRAAPVVEKIDTSKFLTAEQAQHMLGQAMARNGAVNRELVALTSRLAVSHAKEFDAILDVDKLYAFCDQHQIPLNKGGYEAFIKDLRDENNQKAFDKKIAEAKKEGAREALESVQRGDGVPWLVGNGGDGAVVAPREPSVVDILHARKAGKDASAAVAGEATSDVMAAVAEYTAGVGRASLGLGRQ